MDLAKQFLHQWQTTTYTINIARLAMRLDPKVKIVRRKTFPTGTTLRFSDGSVVQTRGTGKNFAIWESLQLP